MEPKALEYRFDGMAHARALRCTVDELLGAEVSKE